MNGEKSDPWIMMEAGTMLSQMMEGINSIRAEQSSAHDVNVKLSSTLQTLLSKIGDRLDSIDARLQDVEQRLENQPVASIKRDISDLGDSIFAIQNALEAQTTLDIRQKNRKIRQHIPFTFQPSKSTLHEVTLDDDRIGKKNRIN